MIGDIKKPLFQCPDIVPALISEIKKLSQPFQINIFDLAVDRDIIDLVARSLIQNEGNGKSGAIRQQATLHT